MRGMQELARRALWGFLTWKFMKQRPERQRRLYRAAPEIAALSLKEQERARKHAPGAHAIAKAKRQAMTARLGMELGRQI